MTPASGRQDHTFLPSASASFVRTLIARMMPPRPSHPAPNVRDDREAPLLWEQDGKGYSSDLGLLKIRIFLQKGLDRGEVICPSGIGACAAQGALQGFLLFERRSFLGWRPLVTSPWRLPTATICLQGLAAFLGGPRGAISLTSSKVEPDLGCLLAPVIIAHSHLGVRRGREDFVT
ncbi:hypothetical protein [Bradyrhizobium erythrophlei]|uniref:hypothetical protein n=1 Tax=Bradyrhizobium erythrophlei TaxID=1437360 RepID=UPI0012AB70A5|nr:hypothetical protein [Bradyrhizobium erythrophlei]